MASSLRWFALVGRKRQPGSSDILSGNGMGHAVGEEDRQEPGVLWVPRPLCAEEVYKKELHDPDNHDGVITDLEPDTLECEVKWAVSTSLLSLLPLYNLG